jgi:plastocyanin
MRKFLLMTAVVVLLTAACGDTDDDAGDDDDGGGGAPVELEGTVNEGERGQVSGGRVEMELDDFYFGPTFTKADSGSTVTVELENEGDTAHTFTIDSLDIDEEVEAGATTEIEVTLPDSGAIRYYCRFHEGQGMQGAFYANDGDAVGD